MTHAIIAFPPAVSNNTGNGGVHHCDAASYCYCRMMGSGLKRPITQTAISNKPAPVKKNRLAKLAPTEFNKPLKQSIQRVNAPIMSQIILRTYLTYQWDYEPNLLGYELFTPDDEIIIFPLQGSVSINRSKCLYCPVYLWIMPTLISRHLLCNHDVLETKGKERIKSE